jgi:predicted nucleotidyltransferase
MRLIQEHQNIIKQVGCEIFGSGAEIYLFGSRVDDLRKGGDIDLYVVPNSNEPYCDLFDKKITLLSKLKTFLGDQQIDLVLSKDKNRSIEKEALRTGIKL